MLKEIVVGICTIIVKYIACCGNTLVIRIIYCSRPLDNVTVRNLQVNPNILEVE